MSTTSRVDAGKKSPFPSYSLFVILPMNEYFSACETEPDDLSETIKLPDASLPVTAPKSQCKASVSNLGTFKLGVAKMLSVRNE